MKFLNLKALAALLILAATSVSFAQTQDGYYGYLENKYKTAADLIAVTDFKEFGHPRSHSCVEFSKQSPLDEAVVRIGLVTRASEGAGPGLPPLSITKILVTEHDYGDLTHMFRTATLEVRAREIRVVQDNPRDMTVLIRKEKDLFYFKRTVTWKEYKNNPQDPENPIEEEKSEVRYGYCFPPTVAKSALDEI